MIKQPGNRQVHAVRWRAINRIPARLHLVDPQRPTQSQRIAGTTAISIRRHHGELPERFQGACQCTQSRRVYAIIIGEKYAHKRREYYQLNAATPNAAREKGRMMPHDGFGQDDDDGDELSAWRAELARVKPLDARQRAPLPLPPDLTQGQHERRQREHAEIMQEAMLGQFDAEDFNTGDEQEFRRGSLPRAILRKLRRGQFAIQSTLDVHGLRRNEAHRATQSFLITAQQRQWRCVKIIHGKGLHSPRGVPVLKHRVEISLRQNDDVLAYCSAPTWAGGHGATLVLLRRG